jgi:hypothetical protein
MLAVVYYGIHVRPTVQRPAVVDYGMTCIFTQKSLDYFKHILYTTKCEMLQNMSCIEQPGVSCCGICHVLNNQVLALVDYVIY